MLSSFGKALRASGFGGDFETGLGAREVASTDNSIYQVQPAAIAYPRTRGDVVALVQAAHATRQPLVARGGNTGTNGQSLGTGVIVDFARHMRAIENPDLARGTVDVEPGVVLDQLNAALRPARRFFPPMVSTATRATLGGMVATDASGKGSRHYGKTSDHIDTLDLVLADGTVWLAEAMPRAAAERLAAGTSTVARLHREALRIADNFADEIDRVFPRMNRGLTGYNLQKIYDRATDRFSLIPLLAGSEGTLALTTRLRLRIAHCPQHRRLAVLRYDRFAAGLEHVRSLLEADPLAIEIVDDKVIRAAKDDEIWASLSQVLGAGDPGAAVGAMNFVEFTGADPQILDSSLARLSQIIGAGWPGLLDWAIVSDDAVIARLWQLREKAVGLLARLGGGRQGMPFVEDTAVPPDRLPDYVAGFRAILDRHGLAYGMFGHADVGCLHVRPFLDMKDPAQAALIRPISDDVAALAKAHGGLLWGEHGRGYRGEYSPFFFGPELYPQVQALKRAFDPSDLLNPGKLASASGRALDRIDAVPLRGAADVDIAPPLAAEFDRALACNGNAACLSWDPADVLCPSYKVTRDRAQSPKGRAALLRGWARTPPEDEPAHAAMEQALAASLSSCLACKACASRCPVRVDVPEMASGFWARYYRKHGRPLVHYGLRWMELGLGIGRGMPRLANALLGLDIVRAALQRHAGLVDLPAFAPARAMQSIPVAVPRRLATLPDDAKRRTLILVEDSFTASFDGRVLDASAAVLARLGYTLLRQPPRANGKHLHGLGWRAPFDRIAKARTAELTRLAATGVRLVGLDAATALLHEHEYRASGGQGPALATLESVLAEDIAVGLCGEPRALDPVRRDKTLLGHCTEQALRPAALGQWQTVLGHFGVAATPRPVGCCGMAGLFGHRADQQALSKQLYHDHWAAGIATGDVLATGFSCRAQAHRLDAVRAPHPIEHLAEVLATPSFQDPSTHQR